ncbi:Hypothetical protein Minf_0871 [Methylacidiphilum infernorum V4]|uniref:Uncharacterized protein n=1 Tax=Methylacidiphilum infernorum (isolate V4) TaxID=481448 RepID=B3E1D0_METI4|nr:Hypothetical protein Minf_0871 [Methylacidiphilum infernorum V4]
MPAESTQPAKLDWNLLEKLEKHFIQPTKLE